MYLKSIAIDSFELHYLNTVRMTPINLISHLVFILIIQSFKLSDSITMNAHSSAITYNFSQNQLMIV